MKSPKTSKLLGFKSNSDEWKMEREEVFSQIKTFIQHSEELSHPKAKHIMCLFTDASDGHCGAMLNQNHPDQLDQEQEPLAVLSGPFTKTQLRWSVIEKEAFPIIEANSVTFCSPQMDLDSYRSSQPRLRF
jgi:hypothetical protein